MASKARIAAYKICWSSGCSDSDILAAMDQAIYDGVHVISLSVGATGHAPQYDHDSIAIGAFSASQHGIVVSCSAGNAGPGPYTAVNIAPWILTVGASTIDREFPADVVLGNGWVFSGVSLYSGDPLVDYKLPLPATEVGEIAANKIRQYIKSEQSPTATILFRGTIIGTSPAAPKVAAFSSRGPNYLTPEILKPDVIAPGVNILAGWTGFVGPTDLEIDPRRALDPGLVYDMDTSDYISFLCAIGYDSNRIAVFVREPPSSDICSGKAGSPGNLNYPSFSVVFQSTSDVVTYKRVVKNVGSSLDAVYEVKVNSPANVDIKVSPSKLVFSAENKTLSYEITFSSVSLDWPTIIPSTFGSIEWSDGIHGVRGPIAVKWRQGSSRDSI
ncbi:subtilisin-like protease SBT1.4 [Populus alba x Populus x berolinensis]|nr:subtilisin-like protease SBT1.4 [Populus alba x Populus x berolinensis]